MGWLRMKKFILALLIAFIISSFSVFAAPPTVGAVTINNVASGVATVNPGTTITIKIPVTVNNTAGTTPVSVTVTSTHPLYSDSGQSLGTLDLNFDAGVSATKDASFSLLVPANNDQGIKSAIATAVQDGEIPVSASYSFKVNAKPALAVTQSSLSVPAQQGTKVTKTLKLENTGNVALTNVRLSLERTPIKDSNDREIVVSFNPSPFDLGIGLTQNVEVSFVVPERYTPKTESSNVLIKADNVGFSTVSVPVTIEVKPLVCKAGTVGSNLDVNLVTPESNDDVEAGTLLAVELDVENTDSTDHDYVVEATLYNLDENKEIDTFETERNINDDETETFKFNMEMDADTDDNDDVRLYVKVYEDGHEETDCEQENVGIDVQELQDKVVIQSLTLSPETPACGTDVFGTVRVVNRDNAEQNVAVTVKSDELSVLKQLSLVTLAKGFRKGSDQFLQFAFTVPETAKPGQYTLNTLANYEDGVTSWQRTFTVRECVVQPKPPVQVVQPTQPTTPATATTPGTLFTGKSVFDRLGEVPTGFWLIANLALALAIFVLALAALRWKR